MLKKILLSLSASCCMLVFAMADEQAPVTITSQDAAEILELAEGFAKYVSSLPSDSNLPPYGKEHDTLVSKGNMIIPFILKELLQSTAAQKPSVSNQSIQQSNNKQAQAPALPGWACTAVLNNTPAGKSFARPAGMRYELDFWTEWWMKNNDMFAGEYFNSDDGKLLTQTLKILASDRLALQKYNAAYNNMLNRNEAEAIKQFGEITKSCPDSKYADDAMFWKGYCMTDMQNYGEAIKTYQKLIETFPQSEYADDSLLKIGETYEIHMHDYDKAIETYKQLAEKFPNADNPASNRVLLGRALENKNDYGNALKNYREAQQEMQTLNEPQQEKNSNWNFWYARTIEGRIKFIEENNDYDWIPLTKYNIAKDFYIKGMYADCEKTLQELLDRYPDSKIADDASSALEKVLDKQSAAQYRLQQQGQQIKQQEQQVRPVNSK